MSHMTLPCMSSSAFTLSDLSICSCECSAVCGMIRGLGAQGCQLATKEDILNEEYPLDYNLPDGPVLLRSQSRASSLSDAGSSMSGSRKGNLAPHSLCPEPCD